MKITKKILALLLSLAMMVTFMPMSIFAVDEQTEDAQETIAQENTEEVVEADDEVQPETLESQEEITPAKATKEDGYTIQVGFAETGNSGDYCFIDGNGELFVPDNNDEGEYYFDKTEESVRVGFKPGDKCWLDGIWIFEDEYRLNPEKGKKSLKDLRDWGEVKVKNNKVVGDGEDGEVWNVFTVNFNDDLKDDYIYIEGKFDTFNPEDASGNEYYTNKFQVEYDDVSHPDGYVELSKNGAAWSKIKNGYSDEYKIGDKLKFRVFVPEKMEGKDPVIEVSEPGDKNSPDGYFIFSDEADEDSDRFLDVTGNTFVYTPRNEFAAGIHVKIWWSTEEHAFDIFEQVTIDEKGKDAYYFVETNAVNDAGIVGFADKYYGASDLTCLDDGKSLLRVKNGSTETIYIRPDGNDYEVDKLVINGVEYAKNPTGTQKAFSELGSKLKESTKYKRGYEYTVSKNDIKEGTSRVFFIAYFRERTDWDKYKGTLPTEKFAYRFTGETAFKTSFAQELYSRYLSNVFESATKVNDALKYDTTNKVEEGKGVAGKGRYHFNLTYGDETIPVSADVLENDTDIVLSIKGSNDVVVPANELGSYTVTMDYDCDDARQFETDKNVKVYGNGSRIDYIYAVEGVKTGTEKIYDNCFISVNVSNDDNINNMLTIYKANYKNRNVLDNFDQPGNGQTQIRYNLHGAYGNNNDRDSITPVGENVVKISDPVLKGTDDYNSGSNTKSYVANVTGEKVTFKVVTERKLQGVYVGSNKITDTDISKEEYGYSFTADVSGDKTVNVYLEGRENYNYSLVNVTNYGGDNLRLSVNGSEVVNTNGENSKRNKYSTIVSYDNKNGDNGNVDITFSVPCTCVLTNAIINGQPVELSSNREERLNSLKELYVFKTVTVAKADVYDIQVGVRSGRKSGDDVEIDVGNFGWSKNGNVNDDDNIDGGDIELVKAVYKNGESPVVYYDENNNNILDIVKAEKARNASYWNPLAEDLPELNEKQKKDLDYDHYKGGEAVFPTGTEVTIRLTPDYGKQLVSFGVNGKHFEKGDANERNEYTFVVQPGNHHLEAKFEKRDNTVTTENNTSEISGEKVSFNNGNPVDAGTMQMVVNENATPATTANSDDVVAAVDISMNNVFYAGQDKVNKAWNDEKSTLESEATISMVVEDIDAGDSVRVIREHKDEDSGETLTQTLIETPNKDGECVKVNSDGTITIVSNKFSTYTICKDSEAKGKLGSATLATTSYTYSGGNKTPAVKTVKNSHGRVLSSKYYTVSYPSARKNVGAYYVTISGKKGTRYYGSSVKVKFTINPKGATIKAPKKAKKSFTAKWSKQSSKMSTKRISGYEVQYSMSSKFTSGVKSKKVKGYKKTSVKIKGLKAKKTYYVRVRTYLGSYKSAWSKTRSVKTK